MRLNQPWFENPKRNFFASTRKEFSKNLTKYRQVIL